jgi:GT2 family glycosyltransferase
MARAFADLKRQQRIDQAIVLCHSPFWRPLACRLQDEFGWPVVYDRMDLHQGFSTTTGPVAEEEQRLLEEADLVTATSGALETFKGSEGAASLRLPNACDPEHWLAAEPSDELRSLQGPVIGYFGAISDWFDTELVIEMAVARPAWSFVLIGSAWGADVARLEQLPNVHILGERSYEDLPSLAAAFDVGIIPFKRTPLIEATDPVKFYEMMALGLEVVAPPIPELAARGDLIHLAEGADAFLLKIENALNAPGQGAVINRRQEFARANTWETRVDVLEEALEGLFPLVSIGIVTFNNLELTQICLDSIERYTVHPNYEIVVVDNASEDGSREWLTEESRRREHLRVVLNDANRGFGAACNQAFAEARGEILCFLNNDTVVTRGWLAPMVGNLTASREIGLVGPSSNGVANEARVDSGYSDLDGLHEWAGEFVARHAGESFSIPMLALYCAALRREVWEEIGGLDERFEIGLFEDDDFSRRVRGAGYDIRCLRDSWIHHFQEASFGALPRKEYARIYEANRRRFREKWKGVR